MNERSKPKASPLRFLGGKKDENVGIELPLASILPSKTNRTIVTEGPVWDDFVASIARWGVIQPIAVRRAVQEDGDATFYELMAGERRYRAAIQAGRTHIYAIVRPEVPDDEALAMQISENVQREDYQPLELAEKLALLESTGKTRAELAALVNKSEKRISDILVQLNLIAPLRQLYTERRISYGHVLIVARLSNVMQEKALKALFRVPGSPRLTTEELVSRIRTDESLRVVPEKDIRIWAQENANLKLKNAGWKLDDATLYPEAGPCTTCPKRSGNNPDLYRELVGSKTDLCMDPACYRIKATAFVKLQKAEAAEADQEFLALSDKETHTRRTDPKAPIRRNQWVPAKKGECPDTAQGILLDGLSAGKKPWVCINEQCKTHPHNLLWNTSSAPAETSEARQAREARLARENDRETAFRRATASRIIQEPFDSRTLLLTFFMTRIESEEYMYMQPWKQVAQWCNWADFPTSGFTLYLRDKVAAMSVDELSKLLLLFQLATDYPEQERYHDLHEDHLRLVSIIDSLTLPRPKLAAATAKPRNKGK